MIEERKPCSECGGTGRWPIDAPSCPWCHGTGNEPRPKRLASPPAFDAAPLASPPVSDEKSDGKSTCSQCDGHGRSFSQVTGLYEGPRCPHCQGRGVEPRRFGPKGTAHVEGAEVQEVLERLRQLGVRRPKGKRGDTLDAVLLREEVDVEVRRLYPEARRLRIRQRDIAEALGLSPWQTHLVVNGFSSNYDYVTHADPQEVTPAKTQEAHVDIALLRTKSYDPAILLEKLDRAGTLRKEWLRSQTDEGYAVREQITEAIRRLAERAHAAGVTKRQIADTLGMTRQGLHYILSGGHR